MKRVLALVVALIAALFDLVWGAPASLSRSRTVGASREAHTMIGSVLGRESLLGAFAPRRRRSWSVRTTNMGYRSVYAVEVWTTRCARSPPILCKQANRPSADCASRGRLLWQDAWSAESPQDSQNSPSGSNARWCICAGQPAAANASQHSQCRGACSRPTSQPIRTPGRPRTWTGRLAADGDATARRPGPNVVERSSFCGGNGHAAGPSASSVRSGRHGPPPASGRGPFDRCAQK